MELDRKEEGSREGGRKEADRGSKELGRRESTVA
jgi:hypothetical protein